MLLKYNFISLTVKYGDTSDALIWGVQMKREGV